MNSPASLSARIDAEASRCVRCGLCQPHCPTYALDRREPESPRGRITLAAALAGGTLGMNPEATRALEHCLACRRCEAVCPAEVHFDALIADTRALLRRQQSPPLRQRILEWLIERPRALAAGAAMLRAAQPVRRLPWLRRWLPQVRARAPRQGLHAAVGEPRGTVAVIGGCMGAALDGAMLAAAVKVLQRLGWSVWLPPAHCCGALHRHAGADARARQLADACAQTVASSPPLAAVLVTASGCYADFDAALAGQPVPVRELVAFVADEALESFDLLPSSRRVALHTPCTQATAVGAADAAARVLRSIPGIDLLELPGRGCCGAAGSHMLLEPARAAALRQPLLDAAADAQVLCSGNIGCRLHLQAGLAAAGQNTECRHPLELLAESLP